MSAEEVLKMLYHEARMNKCIDNPGWYSVQRIIESRYIEELPYEKRREWNYE